MKLPFAFLLSIALAIRCAIAGPTTVPTQNHSLDLSAIDLKPVYENNLTKPQKIVREEDLIEQEIRKTKPEADADWVAEGTGGCIAKDGKLWVAPTPFDTAGQPANGKRSHMVVWNTKKLPADFLLEFDVNPCGSTNGLLIVFFCAAGKNGQDLFDLSLPPRHAVYDAYQRGPLVDYSDAYWSRNKIPAGESETNRLRKNPGAHLVSQGQSQTTGPTDVTHHLRILKIGENIQIEVNGRIVNQWTDPEKPLETGCFGLRSMEGITRVAYSNFKVYQVTPRAPAEAPTTSALQVKRFAENPVIRPDMLPGNDGDNINGPSLIRVPDFLPDRLGNYYLYFAHHAGKYIRMAYADNLHGPWKIYTPGVLQLSEVSACTNHIASPDAKIDDQQKHIRLYFHGPDKAAGAQKSFLATSADGLHFKAFNQPLGWPYFKTFNWNNNWYAVAKGGRLYRSNDGITKFESGPFLLPGVHKLGLDGPGARHVALQQNGNSLCIYYSNIGDNPERILRRKIDLTPDWQNWKTTSPQEVLKPEEDYEGIHLPRQISHVGESTGRPRSRHFP
jgi:hypothetical protein